MVVVTLEKCPLSLRGDLTKWLQEVSLGVYVGNVSARVRDNLWQRICSEAKNGRATMVFSARNEQRFDFRVHNTAWEPIGFDGLKLMLHPSPARVRFRGGRVGTSSASKRLRASNGNRKTGIGDYVVVDLETTGLDPERDEIIEIAAIKVIDGRPDEQLQAIVRSSVELTEDICTLTGLTKDDIACGRDIQSVAREFVQFIGSRPLVMHNAEFDMAFIDGALEAIGYDELENQCIDTLELARKKYPAMTSYRIEDISQALGIVVEQRHRALPDCETTKELFEALMA